MLQGALLMSTPPVVAKVRENLTRASSRRSAAIQKLERLTNQLKSTKLSLQNETEAVEMWEKSCVLVSCQELERLLAKDGKGWCPICRDVVVLEKLGFAYTSGTEFVGRSRGDHGYGGGNEAHTVAVYTNYRVPHRCSKGLPADLPLEGGINGGTIVDAPTELFTSFGIPPLDPEMVKRVKLSPWNFVNTKALRR